MLFFADFQIESESIIKFIKNVNIRNKNTAKQYHSRLLSFERFAKDNDNKSNVDKLIQQLKDKKIDPYDILNDYCLFLQNNNLSGATFKSKIITVKTFLEYNDIEISPRKFKLKVRFPKTVTRHKEAIDKNEIVTILNGCSDIKLKTYVMLLAVTGARATEALSIRNRDLDLESTPAKIRIRGEFTKTKVDRYVLITKELKEQIQKWLDFKYRKRRICYRDSNGKTITEYRIPEKNQNELIFSIYYLDNSNPDELYDNLAAEFAKTLDRIGMGTREESNNGRRLKITLHSFRRFVKSTISDLGFSDYSEWFIGHSGSTYWRKKDSEKAEIFKKIEPYLTFLDIQQLERQGADMQSQIEELQDINQILRNKDYRREEMMRVASERLTKLEEKFDALAQAQEKQRKLDIDLNEKDWDKKFEKHDKLLEATRETIKKRALLEKTIEEQKREQK